MPMWRCPHCGTPQAEAARCWVCRRSSTSCGTCRHFRRAVAANLGYCGLDRQRRPLAGDELRGCWQESQALGGSGTPGALPGPVGGTHGEPARPRLDFIEVATASAPGSPGRSARRRTRAPAEPASASGSAADAPIPGTAGPDVAPRWSLWGELDR